MGDWLWWRMSVLPFASRWAITAPMPVLAPVIKIVRCMILCKRGKSRRLGDNVTHLWDQFRFGVQEVLNDIAFYEE